MKNLSNFLLFQAGWFVCVAAAARGNMWLGPLAVCAVLIVHLRVISPVGGWRRELRYILVVGLLGMLLDSGLGALGATRYPTSVEAWSFVLVPPWITALWVLFATLPHHSLGWLAGRPLLALLLGAVGGPLAYLGGVRMGAVGVGESPWLTWGGLAIEYALLTPLLLHFAGRGGRRLPARACEKPA